MQFSRIGILFNSVYLFIFFNGKKVANSNSKENTKKSMYYKRK